eukprot:scaffold129662_cov72-Phaeocystis_antarctica.AAC.2
MLLRYSVNIATVTTRMSTPGRTALPRTCIRLYIKDGVSVPQVHMSHVTCPPGGYHVPKL